MAMKEDSGGRVLIALLHLSRAGAYTYSLAAESVSVTNPPTLPT